MRTGTRYSRFLQANPVSSRKRSSCGEDRVTLNPVWSHGHRPGTPCGPHAVTSHRDPESDLMKPPQPTRVPHPENRGTEPHNVQQPGDPAAGDAAERETRVHGQATSEQVKGASGGGRGTTPES